MELRDIQLALQKVARRWRLAAAWRGFWQGLLAGGLIWLAGAALYKLLPISPAALTWTGVIAVLAVLAGTVRGWWKKPALDEVARWVDRRCHFEERLSTALELEDKPGVEDWRTLLLADAAGHARKIQARELLPFRLPMISRWTLLILLLGVGIGFVPEYRSQKFLAAQQEKEVIQDTGRQLAEFTRRSLQERPPTLQPTQQSLENLAELGDQFARNPLTRAEALRDLANFTDRLQDEIKQLNAATRQLQRAARESGRGGHNATSELQRKIDALEKSLGDKKSMRPEALEKLSSGLQKASQAASNLPDANSAEGAAAREELAQTLADLSHQAQEMGLSLPMLDDAIAALLANQTDVFLQDLEAAFTDLDKLQEMTKALQQLQQQAALQQGRDLAEQLQFGQAGAAIETLREMIRQLQSDSLTPEDLQKVLDEVSKAIQPATPYGEVGQCLSRAAQRMESGRRDAAAQSLAEAVEELERLLEQLGDCDSLMAALDALKHAQLCIGTGQRWGQCQGGFSPGGKPGRGVGTWAEEQGGWADFFESAGWDNSGIVQPEMDPRGVADRGDPELSPLLEPTRVRGQISPGTPMPSINLKGVSIKGQSTVEFREAMTAAQTDAQSALNQDQIPRAYQSTVRSYFDDMKD